MTRKFGVEIEAFGVPMAVVASTLRANGIEAHVAGYTHSATPYWKVVTDMSLSGPNAFELVSPILEGEAGFAQLELVCRVLAEIGAKVNRSCGLHVHVDGRDLDTRALRNVCKMYVKYEAAFDELVPESRRANGNAYCRSVTRRFGGTQPALKALDGAASVGDLTDAMNGLDGHGRYHKLNLHSMTRHGTVEFRHHSGSVDPAKVVSWARLVTAFVECGATAKLIKANKVTDGMENLLSVLGDAKVRKFYRQRRESLRDAEATE